MQDKVRDSESEVLEQSIPDVIESKPAIAATGYLRISLSIAIYTCIRIPQKTKF